MILLECGRRIELLLFCVLFCWDKRLGKNLMNQQHKLSFQLEQPHKRKNAHDWI